MNEETMKSIIRSHYGVPKSEEIVIRKESHLYSTIWTAAINSNINTSVFVIKQSDQDLHTQAELWIRAEKLFRDDKTYVPLDVVYLADHDVIISRKSGYPTLAEQIAWNGFPNPFTWYQQTNHIVELAGTWLRRYHGYETRVGSISRPLLKYIEIREKHLEVLPERLGEKLVDMVGNCPDHTVTIVHSDFSPHNILSNGENLSVIDFGINEWTEMSPYWDIATLSIALERIFRFAFRNPLRWMPPLRKQVVSRFTNSYGDVYPDNPYVWHACCATRHFALLGGIIDSSINDPRIAWHMKRLEECLSMES